MGGGGVGDGDSFGSKYRQAPAKLSVKVEEEEKLEQMEKSGGKTLFMELQERMEKLKESGKDLRLPEVPMVTAFR